MIASNSEAGSNLQLANLDDSPNVSVDQLVDDVITLIEKLSEADPDSLSIVIDRLGRAVNVDQVLATLAGTVSWDATYDDIIRYVTYM